MIRREATEKPNCNAVENPDCLMVAVVSDLHAYKDAEPDDAPSHYCLGDPGTDPGTSPLAGLRDLIKAENLTADLLLCPGDLADKADPVAIQHVWRELHDIKAHLKAPLLAATSGNHDVDSRYQYNDFDAKGVLQALNPPYPLPDDALNDRYWSRHFSLIVDRAPYRLLVLNSSAFHGEGRYEQTKQYEFQHGRISEHTLAAIKRELDASPRDYSVNILLCHHHPHPHSELRLSESDLMAGGRHLVELLGSGTYGRWIIVHGHKHHPKIENAAGGTSSPVILAAGSLCATLYRELQTAARNQFYILTFPFALYHDFGFVGRFKAWDWLSGSGWVAATERSGLPSAGGFGWRGDISLIAKQISSIVSDRTVPWNEVRASIPIVDYILPQDLRSLCLILQRNHFLTVVPEYGIPFQVGLPV